jgi:multidrug efflux pump subunit AcrA (membrane-fusion protein)
MRKKHKILIGAGVVVAAAGGFAFARRGPKPTPVEVATVAREDLQAKVTANGKVQAKKKVDISATIPGQITLLAVKEGDRVTKGQLLLQIDAVNPRATARSTEFSMQALLQEQESARATLDQAAPTCGGRRRTTPPTSSRSRISSGPAPQWPPRTPPGRPADRRVLQAQATLEGARDTLSKTTVRSPIDGIVTAKRVEEGEVAVIGIQNSPGTVLLTISDMATVETELEVDETSIPSVKVGRRQRYAWTPIPTGRSRAWSPRWATPILAPTGSANTAIDSW